MNKKHIPTEEIRKYNKAFIKFMKDDEENKFRMPPLPLLTLDGIKKKPDKEISVSELKPIAKEEKIL